jgi:hypothetical protein
MARLVAFALRVADSLTFFFQGLPCDCGHRHPDGARKHEEQNLL